jgi:heat shock protein HslJ
MKKIYLIMLAMFIVSACGGTTAASIIGSWKLISYGSPSNPTVAAADVVTSIEFSSGGKLMGNVGCNGFGGDYQMDGDTITFGPIISTMMACENPIAEQEFAVLKTFTETASYILNADTLTITSTDGTSSVVLARK